MGLCVLKSPNKIKGTASFLILFQRSSTVTFKFGGTIPLESIWATEEVNHYNLI